MFAIRTGTSFVEFTSPSDLPRLQLFSKSAAVLACLLEVLLMRHSAPPQGRPQPPVCCAGLADDRLAAALRQMHAEPSRAWTVRELAKEAALSRSTLFNRFRQEIGLAPMEYLLGWRMAIAKQILRCDGLSVAEVAQRVGYSSSSTFSVAFARQVGASPTSYARGTSGQRVRCSEPGAGR